MSPEASSRKQTEPGVPTVTENAHTAVLPAASDAVHVTVVVPTGKNVPDAGTQTTDAPVQLSETEGVANATVAPTLQPCACEADTVMSEGQESVGAVASVTTTGNAHVAVFPAASVALHVTTVVPGPNDDPEGGEQTRFVPAQLSEAVTL